MGLPLPTLDYPLVTHNIPVMVFLIWSGIYTLSLVSEVYTVVLFSQDKVDGNTEMRANAN